MLDVIKMNPFGINKVLVLLAPELFLEPFDLLKESMFVLLKFSLHLLDLLLLLLFQRFLLKPRVLPEFSFLGLHRARALVRRVLHVKLRLVVLMIPIKDLLLKKGISKVLMSGFVNGEGGHVKVPESLLGTMADSQLLFIVCPESEGIPRVTEKLVLARAFGLHILDSRLTDPH